MSENTSVLSVPEPVRSEHHPGRTSEPGTADLLHLIEGLSGVVAEQAEAIAKLGERTVALEDRVSRQSNRTSYPEQRA